MYVFVFFIRTVSVKHEKRDFVRISLIFIVFRCKAKEFVIKIRTYFLSKYFIGVILITKKLQRYKTEQNECNMHVNNSLIYKIIADPVNFVSAKIDVLYSR